MDSPGGVGAKTPPGSPFFPNTGLSEVGKSPLINSIRIEERTFIACASQNEPSQLRQIVYNTAFVTAPPPIRDLRSMDLGNYTDIGNTPGYEVGGKLIWARRFNRPGGNVTDRNATKRHRGDGARIVSTCIGCSSNVYIAIFVVFRIAPRKIDADGDTPKIRISYL